MDNTTDLKDLRKIFNKIEQLKHITKTNDAYLQAQEIISNIPNTISRDINRSVSILKKYNLKGTETSKKYVIEEFKEESLFDIGNVINRLQKNSDPTIE